MDNCKLEKAKKFFILEILLKDEESPIKTTAAFENIVDIATSITKLHHIPCGWKTCLIISEASSREEATNQIRCVSDDKIRNATIISVTNAEKKKEMEELLDRYKDPYTFQYFLKHEPVSMRTSSVDKYKIVDWSNHCSDFEYREIITIINHIHSPYHRISKKTAKLYQEMVDVMIQEEFLTHRMASFIVRKLDKDFMRRDVTPEKVQDLMNGVQQTYVLYDFTMSEMINFMRNIYQNREDTKQRIDFFCIDTSDITLSLYRLSPDKNMTIMRIS